MKFISNNGFDITRKPKKIFTLLGNQLHRSEMFLEKSRKEKGETPAG